MAVLDRNGGDLRAPVKFFLHRDLNTLDRYDHIIRISPRDGEFDERGVNSDCVPRVDEYGV